MSRMVNRTIIKSVNPNSDKYDRRESWQKKTAWTTELKTKNYT